MAEQEDIQELKRRLAMAESRITELQAAEQASRENEKRYRALFETLDDGFCILEVIRDENDRPIDLSYVEVNPAVARHGVAGIVQGMTARQVSPNLEARWLEVFDGVARTGLPVHHEEYNGDLGRWFRQTLSSLGGAGSPLVSLVYTDISDRKQTEQALRESEERQAFLLKLSDELRPLRDAQQIQQTAIELMGERLGVNRAGYYEVGADEDTFFLTARWERGAPPLPERMLITDFGDEIRAGYQVGRTMVARDTEQDAASEPNLAAVRALQIRAWIGVPLVKEGRWFAAIGVHSLAARDWTPAEIRLVEETGERTWAATERARAEEALRASEGKYRALFESIDEGFCIIEMLFDEHGNGKDYAFLETNPVFEQQATFKIVPGQRMREIAPEHEQYWFDIYGHIAMTGEPARFEHHAASLGRTYDVYAFRVGEPELRRVAILFRNITESKRAEIALRESEVRQAFLLQLSDALRPLSDPVSVQTGALKLLVGHLGLVRAAYYEIDDDGNGMTLSASVETDAVTWPGRMKMSDFGADISNTYRAGYIYAVGEAETDPRLTVQSRVAIRDDFGIQRLAGVPLVKAGKLRIVLGVHAREPRHWREDELQLLKEVADRTWASAERAIAESALRESEQNLHGVANIVPDLLWYSEPEGSTPWYNDRWLDYTGQTLEQAIGWGWLDAIHPDDREDSARRYREAVEQNKPLQQEHRIRRHTGEYRWFLVRAEPRPDERGRVTRMYGAATDIQDQRLAMEALRESEERFRQFANASAAGLWMRDARTLEMEFVSPAVAAIYGVEEEALLGDVKRWASLIVPDDRELAMRHIEEAREGKSVVHEFRIRRPSDGVFRWIRNTDFPLRDKGHIPRIGGIVEDVSEVKLAVERQAVLLAELQHRVRNIMAMTRSVAQRTAKNAQDVADYAALISGRLMSLARTQALLTRAANVSVDLESLLHMELYAQANDESQYSLSGPKVRISPKAAEVLSLSIHELATNALKYGAFSVAEGKIAVVWHVRKEQDSPVLHLQWTETRPAIANWTPPTRRGFGSELVERRVPYELDGEGKVELTPEGARVSIAFPLQPGASILETSAPVRKSVFGGSIDMNAEQILAGQRILVVEDDYLLAYDTQSALESAGATVIGPFAKEDEARNAIREGDLTVALTDINLGKGPSFEIAKALQQAQLPFAFLTGYDQSSIPGEFAEVPRFVKPIDTRQMVRDLSSLVQTAGTQAEKS